MVEAMILISESAYKQLLNSEKKYLELLKKQSVDESSTIDKQHTCTCTEKSKEKGKSCSCNDQFGEGIEVCGSSLACKEDKGDSEANQTLIADKIPFQNQFKTNKEFFSDLVNQSWYKRSPQRSREIAETIFYSSGLLIGKDNSLHFEGSRIDGSNIYNIIRNEVTKGKKYIPGKIIIDRILERSNFKVTVKQRKPREKKVLTEDYEPPEHWYRVL